MTKRSMPEQGQRPKPQDETRGTDPARRTMLGRRRLPYRVLIAVAIAQLFFMMIQVGEAAAGEESRELSWERPGRLSIYDLQLGPAVLKNRTWKFQGNIRLLNASTLGKSLTLMVRLNYNGSRSGIPLKFVIKLPRSRQYDETVHLTNRRGKYSYRFTIHRPEEFVGSGSVYVYYGFSLVDVLDFTIVPGS